MPPPESLGFLLDSTAPPEVRAAGVVLCGGLSSRMGRPKSWLPYGGQTLLQRVVNCVSAAISGFPVVVVAAHGQELPELPSNVLRVNDDPPDCGPLGGLASALRALQGKVEMIFLSSCDVPFLKTEFIQVVLNRLLDDFDCACPFIGGRLHPLAAAYKVSLLPTVETRLHQGNFRMTDLLHAIRTRRLSEPEFSEADPDLQSLQNINTSQEYHAVLGELAARSKSTDSGPDA